MFINTLTFDNLGNNEPYQDSSIESKAPSNPLKRNIAEIKPSESVVSKKLNIDLESINPSGNPKNKAVIDLIEDVSNKAMDDLNLELDKWIKEITGSEEEKLQENFLASSEINQSVPTLIRDENWSEASDYKLLDTIPEIYNSINIDNEIKWILIANLVKDDKSANDCKKRWKTLTILNPNFSDLYPALTNTEINAIQRRVSNKKKKLANLPENRLKYSK